MDGFNDKVYEILDKFSYDVFIIQHNKDFKCTCVNFNTNQADPNCPKCLGMGYKIKIRKIKAASQETTIPSTMKPTNTIMIAKNYYIKSMYPVRENNIIVDDDEIYYVYKKSLNNSFHGEKVYQKCLCPVKKLDSKIFMQNFNKIIGR